MIKIECETEAQARKIEDRAGGVVHFARRSWWVVLAGMTPEEYRAQVPAHARRGTVCHRVSDSLARSRQPGAPKGLDRTRASVGTSTAKTKEHER